jgi:serine/threonine-protein kinase
MRAKGTDKKFDEKVELYLAGNTDLYGPSIVQECIPHGVLDSLLGVGGEKLVLLYTDTILKCKRVLNIRLPTLTSSGEQRFMRGARILNRIVTGEIAQGHIPPFPMVYELREYPPFYVTQFIAGVTVREYLEKQPNLSLIDRLVLFRRIAEGIHLLHTYATVHRDIKPDNIMVDQHGYPKILDFGIAISCYENPLTRTDAQLGTPEYAAPEQMIDAGSVDHRADIYALAKVLFFMMIGDESFDPVKLPSELMMVIPKALQSDPMRRHETVLELMEAVAAAYPDLNLMGKMYSAPQDMTVASAFSDLIILYGSNPGKVKQLLDLTLTEWETLMAMAKISIVNGGR